MEGIRPPTRSVAGSAQRDPADTLRLEKPRNAYYDATQLRTDTWVRVRDAAAAMVMKGGATSRVAGGEDAATAVRLESDLTLLRELESYWAFPGVKYVDAIARMIRRGDDAGWKEASTLAGAILRLTLSNIYRRRDVPPLPTEHEHYIGTIESAAIEADARSPRPAPPYATALRGYFEVLFVDAISPEQEEELIARMMQMRRPEDEFEYGVVVAPSYEDAIIAALFNPTIQSCVIRYSFPRTSSRSSEVLRRYLATVNSAPAADSRAPASTAGDIGIELGRVLKALRPELDLFLVTDTPLSDLAGRLGPEFRRVFYTLEDYREMHLSLIKGIDERFDTPFFDALREYSRKPTGVFHALPISRGKSVAKSHWIADMAQFYGENIFLAETSATGGGLDSLLQPSGPLKRAQLAAARAFGAEHTYFVTNGTSTANKIVVQSLVRPGDIVLVSRDCHKSHHYALILAGAHPVYMDPYPISEYSMYGGVPLATIKRHLLALRDAGKLDRVRMLLLTNCTFDGIIYDPLRIMREVLAIKPDMIFVWDEAWFAFATFNPTYRQRTGMWAAAQLQDMLSRPEYRREYAAWREAFSKKTATDDDHQAAWLRGPLLPDPDAARVRVYVTQSTHKTLTALRQGSMIHIRDDEFERAAADAFHEAYMTHTSTSPNYQILASLDVGRRQMELEGYELVQEQVELAMSLRQCIHCHPLLGKYLRLLTTKRLIPEDYRPSGTEYYYDPETGFMRMLEAFAQDEFVLDPSRVSVAVGGTGVEGDAFKRKLIEEFDIQINKTTRNTLLFMTHVGTSRGTVAYLVEVLTRLIRDLDRAIAHQSPMERRLHDARVKSLTLDLPPLPDFSRFHAAFNVRPDDGVRRSSSRPAAAVPTPSTPEGDMRRAFYLAYDEAKCEYLKMDGTIARAITAGREVVAACFVTPYPPGFPVLVPGQVISMEILSYLKALDVKEIHGYQPDYGLRVFTQAALDAILSEHDAQAGDLPFEHDAPASAPSRDLTSTLATSPHTSPPSVSIPGSSRDAAHAPTIPTPRPHNHTRS